MPKFFITHSWKDIEFAKRLTNDLSAHGLDGFFDAYSIQPGDMIPAEIARGLEGCDIYVPLLSYAALASPWCDEEINAAITLGKMPGRNGRPRIIPILIENCQDRMSVFLHNRLYINFTNRYDEAFKELLTKGFGVPLAQSKPPATMPGGSGRFVPSYTLGNDNYDTAYSLETPRGEFLGECGMGISETIGEGKPDKVTAFDLWLFDNADVRIVTRILMSGFAFKDQILRAKLVTKGEAILAEKGKTMRLETASLRLDVQIIELIYAANPNYPPNSHFQKLIVELVPTLKEGAAAR